MNKKEKIVRGGAVKPKRERKSLPLSIKVEVIKRLEAGERNKDICKALNLSKSTVATVWKDKSKHKKCAESVVGGSKLSRVSRARHPLFERLEKLLLHWIDSHNQRGTPLSFILIQRKAVTLFEDLKKKAIEDSEERDDCVNELQFKGSHGWFERFKKRGCLHNIKITGEAASADSEAAAVFPSELQKIIDEGGYKPKQIFNLDETGLFWKRMPSHTFISQDEKKAPGHKASKDRLTLMLGGNLEGDVKIKPLLVYHSENPRALKGLMKSSLPVVWRSNRKAWVTREVFIDYVNSYLSPFIANYFAKNNLSNKALLLLDNAPGHPVSMVEYGENIQVVFLPPNTTSLIQPMDQGVIVTFKAYYLQLLMEYLIDGFDSENKDLKALWKEYSIKIALKNIAKAWDKIAPSTMNAVWKKLLPDYVYDFEGFEDGVEEIRNNIVELAGKAGFDGVDEENVQDVLQSHNEELTNEELIELDSQRLLEGGGEKEEVTPTLSLDTKTLKEIFGAINHLTSLLEKYDPNFERSLKAKNTIDGAVQCYREIYDRKLCEAKQSSILSFFSAVNFKSCIAFANGKRCHEYNGSGGYHFILIMFTAHTCKLIKVELKFNSF